MFSITMRNLPLCSSCMELDYNLPPACTTSRPVRCTAPWLRLLGSGERFECATARVLTASAPAGVPPHSGRPAAAAAPAVRALKLPRSVV